MTSNLSEALAAFATSAPISAESRIRARIVLADALIAMLSGRVLPAGAAALRFADAKPGVEGRSREFASLRKVDAPHAAFINGVLAHANETDDSHESARMHPSCSIVPAALGTTEASGGNVARLLDSIAIGYDVGVALNLATWTDPRVLRASRVSTHHTGAVFGSLGAAIRGSGSLQDVGATALSYAVQHVGGSTTWLRDTEHVEKAVVFGGLPARSALFSLELAGLGFSGVKDPFGGPESYFDAFGVDSDPAIAFARLQQPGLAVTETCIKRYPIGMPIQAAMQAVDELVGLGNTALPGDVLIELPAEKVHVVDNREMANISAQYVVALRLLSGDIAFDVLHELAPGPEGIDDLRKRIKMVGVRELDADSNGHDTTRVARVTMAFGSESRSRFVAWPIGTPVNPIGWDGVTQKSREVLGGCGWSAQAAEEMVEIVRVADDSASCSDLVDAVAALVG